MDPDRWEFANEGFLRGQKHLLKSITRRKPAHGHGNQHHQQAHGQSSSVGACVEVGKFGLEEEVERLKRDKNVLMQELVRLRQQQQATDNQLQTMVQRLQGMEQRQQQMMSFLAKAVQSPGFLAQFVQQQTESNRRISEANKKRRLKEEGVAESENPSPPDGQIVKYQPQVNESAHAVLRQLRKLDANFNSNADNIYIGDSSSTSVMESKNPGNRVSGVTLQEVPAVPVPSHIPVAAVSEIKSSPVNATVENVSAAEFPEISGLVSSEVASSLTHPQTDVVMPELCPMRDIVENSVDIPRPNYMVGETGDEGFMDLTSVGLNGTMPIDIDKLSPDPDIESLLDDASWEQFLDHNIIPGEDDGSEVPSVEALMSGKAVEPLENGWDKRQNMDQLTEQMGLLNSDTNLA